MKNTVSLISFFRNNMSNKKMNRKNAKHQQFGFPNQAPPPPQPSKTIILNPFRRNRSSNGGGGGGHHHIHNQYGHHQQYQQQRYYGHPGLTLTGQPVQQHQPSKPSCRVIWGEGHSSSSSYCPGENVLSGQMIWRWWWLWCCHLIREHAKTTVVAISTYILYPTYLFTDLLTYSLLDNWIEKEKWVKFRRFHPHMWSILRSRSSNSSNSSRSSGSSTCWKKRSD